MADESLAGGAGDGEQRASGLGGARTRPRSFEITDGADRLTKHFKEAFGVNYRIQIERMLKFVADRGRSNGDQFFSLVIHSHFGEHEARQMIQLLASEFNLRADIRATGLPA
jgi:hypothetical protein